MNTVFPYFDLDLAPQIIDCLKSLKICVMNVFFLNLKRLHVKSEENNSTTSKVTLLAFNILKILARCTIVMVKTVNVHVRKFPNLDVVFFCSLSLKRHFQIFFFYYSFFLTSTDQSLKYMNPQKTKVLTFHTSWAGKRNLLPLLFCL